jgi:hypothetical protein
MSTTPAYSTIIRGAFERLLADVAGGMPGRVESYDAAHQRADVQPLVLDGSVDADTGDRSTRRLGVITDVPVLMLGTARSRTTMDVQPGDTVWLMASRCSLDAYLLQGGEVDPQDDRRYHLSDAVCLPAVFDFAHVPADASADGAVIHAARLRLGGPSASDPVARKSDLDAVVQAIKSDLAAIKAHSHPASSGTTSASLTLTGINTVTTPACSPVVSSR